MMHRERKVISGSFERGTVLVVLEFKKNLEVFAIFARWG
jgi:hypothetical protein